MSLDVYLYGAPEIVKPTLFSSGITHNLGKMAAAAGIYQCIWRPEEIDATRARHLIDPLREGLARLRSDPAHFRTFGPPNGWGSYEGLVLFVERYLAACEANPDAEVEAWR